MTDPKAPEMAEVIRTAEDGFPIFPDNGQSMHLVRQLRALDDDTRAFLAAHGLHIASAADKRVLAASGAIHQRWLESYVNSIVPTQADPQAFAWAQAELSRRKTP